MENLNHLSRTLLTRLTSAENGVQVVTKGVGYLIEKKLIENVDAFTTMFKAAVDVPSFKDMNLKANMKEVGCNVSKLSRHQLFFGTNPVFLSKEIRV